MRAMKIAPKTWLSAKLKVAATSATSFAAWALCDRPFVCRRETKGKSGVRHAQTHTNTLWRMWKGKISRTRFGSAKGLALSDTTKYLPVYNAELIVLSSFFG